MTWRIAVAAACSASALAVSPAGAAAPAPVPGTTWAKVKPAAAGLDAAVLDRIARTAEQGKSNCLVVVRGGRLAGEWSFRGSGPASTQEVFSATKSITSTLVGIAQDDGALRIDDPASRWIPQWRGTASAGVTVRDLLSNDSGRAWSPAIDYVQLITAPDRTAFAVALGQTSPPGTVWAYNNSAIQTLQRVLQAATGQDVRTFANRRLFGPLGMTATAMTTDRAGNAQTFMGVRSSCRDMARFGVLMLNRGRWGRRQVVSARWVQQATGRPSTKLNAAYGYLWWLNRKGHVAASPLVATSLAQAQDPAVADGRLVPHAPSDLYWALGLGNQLVQVDPGSGTVVVRLGTGEPRPQPPTFGPAEASRVVTDAVRPGRARAAAPGRAP
jgi:CubicO group peptidase (beta-lactamase class C family)